MHTIVLNASQREESGTPAYRVYVTPFPARIHPLRPTHSTHAAFRRQSDPRSLQYIKLSLNGSFISSIQNPSDWVNESFRCDLKYSSSLTGH